MELSFYKNLDPTQRAYADQIAATARKMGVPPELAVAVAFKESRLNPRVGNGSAGEIGIMQIKPDTAKEMGFSLEDISTPEKNIEAGLSYLKKSLELSEGNPKLAAAGYNAGVNHPFFTSKGEKLPDTTNKYLIDLNTYGAFSGQPSSQASSQPQAKAPVEFVPPPSSLDESDLQAEVDKFNESRARERAGLVGLGVGAAETTRRAIPAAARALGQAVQEGKMKAELKAPFAQKPPTPPLGGTMAPNVAADSTAMNRILQGTLDPESGATGRARMQGFNVETAQQAARAKEAARNLGALQRQGVIAQTAPEVFAKAPGMTSSPSGVLYPRAAAAAPPAAPKGGLEEVTRIFRQMIERYPKTAAATSTVAKYGAPPLAFMQAGRELGSLSEEAAKEEPDYLKMGLSGLGAAGAVMSAFPPTAAVGVPLAITAPLIQYLRENKGQRPEGQVSEIVAP